MVPARRAYSRRRGRNRAGADDVSRIAEVRQCAHARAAGAAAGRGTRRPACEPRIRPRARRPRRSRRRASRSSAALGQAGARRRHPPTLGAIDEIPGAVPSPRCGSAYTASVSLKGGGSVSIWVQQGGRRQIEPSELARNAVALGRVIRPDRPGAAAEIARAYQPGGLSGSASSSACARLQRLGGLRRADPVLGAGDGRRVHLGAADGGVRRVRQHRAAAPDRRARARAGPGLAGSDRLRLNTFVDQTTGQTRLVEDLTISIGQRNDISLSSNLFGRSSAGFRGWARDRGTDRGGRRRARIGGAHLRMGDPAAGGYSARFRLRRLARDGPQLLRYRSLWNDADSVIARSAAQIPFFGPNRLVVDGQRLPEGRPRGPSDPARPPRRFSRTFVQLRLPIAGGASGASGRDSERVRVVVARRSPDPAGTSRCSTPGIYSRLGLPRPWSRRDDSRARRVHPHRVVEAHRELRNGAAL